MRAGHPKRVLLSALAIALLLIPLLNMASSQVGFCSIGGTENTVIIYPTADVYAFGEYSRPQLKFDVRGIPPGSNIISAKLWLYRLNADNWDGNVALYRVENQAWDETITASEFDAQTLTDGENHASKFMSYGWDNLDVLTQLKVDHDANHTFTSFRLMWVNDNENELSIGVDDVRFLLISGEAKELSIVFCASEYNGRDSYLELVYAPPPYAVLISVSPTYRSGVPGEILNFTVTVKNTGNFSDNYVLTVDDNAGWSPTLDNSLLVISENENRTTTLRVHIPENAIGCTSDNITVTATSQGDNTKSDNASCVAHATVVRGVDVSISPPYQSVLAGTTLNYTVTIINTGNTTDNYALSANDSENWDPELSENQFDNIPPFESNERETTLSVIIPENTVPCTEDHITVAVTSQADNTIENSASCIAHAKAASEPPGDGEDGGEALEDNTPPPTPSLISPTNGENITDNTPLLDWSDVSDPSGVTYDLSIAGDAGFAPIILLKTSLTASTYELTSAEALAAGACYWRVRAVDGAGNAGSWSENWSFIVSAVPPPPAPADFTVRGLIISPLEAALGEEISISVTVKNTGDLEGTCTVTLEINDVVEVIENVTLAGGTTKWVIFKVVEDTEGTYNVEVDGLTGSFSVVAPPPPGVPWIVIIVLLAIAMAAAAPLFYMWRRRRKSSKHR